MLWKASKTLLAHEFKHDFLWRHYVALPEKGTFAVFNRTHYESVLVTRIHLEYLLNINLPGIEKLEDITENFWDNRFESIKPFEKHLAPRGMIILKFFLHLSQEEQRKQLLNLLETPKDICKFSVGELQ